MKNAVAVPSSLKPNRNGAAISTPARRKSITACACTGIDLISPVGRAVAAVTARRSTPTTIDTAVAVSFSKENRNGAAMNSAAAMYSTTPWTNAGIGPCLNMVATLAEEDFGGLEELRVEQLRLREGLVERDELDPRAPQRGHLAEVPLGHRVDGRDAEARAEHAVVGQR